MLAHRAFHQKQVHQAYETSYQKNIFDVDIIHQRRNCKPNESNKVFIYYMYSLKSLEKNEHMHSLLYESLSY